MVQNELSTIPNSQTHDQQTKKQTYNGKSFQPCTKNKTKNKNRREEEKTTTSGG